MKQQLKKFILDISFIWQFAWDDFKKKYAGSALGVAWAFLQPIITMVLYWFVFQLGFKSQPIDDFPFILWLMAGLTPWFFISEAVVNATASLVDYKYLVKQVQFNINILPLAKVISTLLVQFVLIIFVIICFCLNGNFPDLYYFQIIGYMIYMIILVLGISYITATLFVFFKDVMQIVSIVTQIIFWLTPIVWSMESMPIVIQRILSYNPIFYVITGYRNAFVNGQWSSHGWWMVLYYWTINLLILIVGLRLFKKCKKHFADVL